MGPSLRDPCLSWASWLLGVIVFLSVCSSSAEGSEARGPGSQDSGACILLKGIQGGSVWFHVSEWPGKDLGAKLEETTWAFASGSAFTMFLRVQGGTGAPTWFSLMDSYKARVQVPNVTSLKIENLTLQDSGRYKAYSRLSDGPEVFQIFHLKVYEPVSPPLILVKALSITPGWCNVTLECSATGATEDLNVIWESKSLPWELEQRGTPGPGPKPWAQAVSLSLSDADASLTCVVSNPVDQNNATSDLGDICLRGAEPQQDHRVDDDGIYYVPMMDQASHESYR
ncbi:PREDICTED: SLAM family member 9-like [Chinchilla lanigera]|uniref:SLAM family member 9-like n=1 Tax=Chinchilla lanigera TaxID=34839 RepID=UPI000698852D|nr:PREDICTED: SLAM family member 9-like [Chinchilla lanigera]